MNLKKKIIRRTGVIILVIFLLCIAPGQPDRSAGLAEATPISLPNVLLNYLPLISRPDFYYVSPLGSNSNKGSIDQPWRTVQYAVDHAHPGATIYVRGGDYNEAVDITSAGQAGKLITVAGYENEKASIDGGSRPAITGTTQYWILRNLNLTSSADRTIWLEPVSNWGIFDNYILGAIVIIGDHNIVQGNEIDGSLHRGNENGIMDGGIESHHNQYLGNTVHDFTDRGIWSQWKTHDIRINDNHVYNISGPYGACIDLDSAIGVTYRNFVQGNIIHDCGSIGIELENSFETLVENNLVYNTGIEGIVAINYLGCEVGGENGQYGSPNGDCRGVVLNTIIRQNIIYNGGTTGGIVGYASAGVKVTANVIYGGSSTALFLADDVNWCRQWQVFNNIFSNQGRAEISVYNPASLEQDQYNLLYHPGKNAAYQVFGIYADFFSLAEWRGKTGLGKNSIESNPLFVDAAGGNFHVKPTSPAVDQGIDPGIPVDFDGQPRPQGAGYDIGAYEQ